MKVTFLLPENFKWECQQCGKCCIDIYNMSHINLYCYHKAYLPSDLPSNLVYMTVFEIRKLAKQLNMHPFDFSWPIMTLYDDKKQHIADIYFTFKSSHPMHHCIFFDWKTKTCKIHPTKPLDCRIYPFQDREDLSVGDEIAVSVDMACSGIGKGDFIDLKKLNNLVLQRELLRRKSKAYWIKKKIPIPRKLFDSIRIRGTTPSPAEAINALKLRKYI